MREAPLFSEVLFFKKKKLNALLPLILFSILISFNCSNPLESDATSLPCKT